VVISLLTTVIHKTRRKSIYFQSFHLLITDLEDRSFIHLKDFLWKLCKISSSDLARYKVIQLRLDIS